MKKFFLVFFSLVAFGVVADEIDRYTINDLPVYEVDKDATSARQRAMVSGQRKAFNSVLDRLSIDPSNGLMVTDDEIAQTLLSMQIKNEKITANSYSASLNIQFNPEYVRHILNKHKITEKSKKIESFIVIPVYNDGSNTFLWENSNLMMKTFDRTLRNNKTIIPVVDTFSTRNLIDMGNFSRPSFSNFKKLAESYNVNNVVLVSTKYKNGSPTIDSKITVLNAYETRNANLNYTRTEDNLNSDLHDSSLKIVEYLEGLYENDEGVETVVSGLGSNRVNIFLYISNIRDLLNIESELKTNRNVTNMKLVMVSKNRAVYLVDFTGEGIYPLVDSLRASGHKVDEKSDGLHLF